RLTSRAFGNRKGRRERRGWKKVLLAPRPLETLRLMVREDRGRLVARDERSGIGRAFDVAAGEIDTAHRPIARVASDCRTCVVEDRVKNVLAMFPSPHAVVDDQRDDHVSRGGFAVGNVFAPERAPGPMTIHALAR